MSAFKLDGKVALVTGGGGTAETWGVGKAISVALARQGAKLCVLDVSRQAADVTRETVEAEGGVADVVVADVAKSAEVATAVARCIERFGRLDILINNVALGSIGGPVELGEDEWDRVMAVNLKSMFLCCKAALPEMVKAGAGRIVNISSIAAYGYTGNPLIAYSVSKAAGHQIAREVAVQYGARGIRANTVVVGMLDTPIIRRHIADFLGKDAVEPAMHARDAQIPVGRQGTAWDVAHAVAFLASDEAQFINGAEIVVDGGSGAKCT